ncbi:unnamed protein product [Alopecurus aequalis]
MSCTSCRSCKLRDENLYRNLDDEKKHFLVLMMGDFRDEMIIPEEFLQRFKGEIPEEIKLETRKGDSHNIVVAKNQEKRVLTVGWRQFIESYDLHMGDSVILKYNGNSQFNVIILDKLGREKALSVVLDPFMTAVQNRRSDAHEIGSTKNMDASCGRCKSYLEYHYMNLDDEKKNLSMLMMGDFQHAMIIPEEFVQRFKGEIPGEFELETQNCCRYIIGVAKHQEKLVLTVGWWKFVQTFGLQMGDTIVFRYNGNSKFSVTIFDKLGCENALSVVVDPFLAPMQERHTNVTETVNRSNIHPQSAQMQSPIKSMNTSYVIPQPMEIQPSTSTVNGMSIDSLDPFLSPVQERHTNATKTVNRCNIYPQSDQMQLPVESMNTSHVLPQPMEIQPSTSRVNGMTMDSTPMERQRHIQMDKSCQGNMATMDISSESSEDSQDDVPSSNYTAEKKSRLFPVQKERLKDGYITTHKTRLTFVQKEAVKQKVQSIHSETPVVVAVMSKSSVESTFVVTFPNLYAKEYLGVGLHFYLRLLDKTWEVRFSDTSGRKKLCTGWKKFVEDNNLKIGDICLFELLSNQKRTMEVYIIRRNDDN